MAKVTVTDFQTKTSVQLSNKEAELVASEIAIVQPGLFARLFMRFFPGPNVYPKIAPDFEIVVEDGGRTTVFELLTETVLQRKDDQLGFNFFLGSKVVAWHATHSGVARL
ncbi:hypothetical protein [Maritalea sp.]|jgi:hypothetical protein|uniref:hypothetical protein n=1 Tax=Maritalea sp. TaxID=2003361 RepID=UPI0039E222D5